MFLLLTLNIFFTFFWFFQFRSWSSFLYNFNSLLFRSFVLFHRNWTSLNGIFCPSNRNDFWRPLRVKIKVWLNFYFNTTFRNVQLKANHSSLFVHWNHYFCRIAKLESFDRWSHIDSLGLKVFFLLFQETGVFKWQVKSIQLVENFQSSAFLPCVSNMTSSKSGNFEPSKLYHFRRSFLWKTALFFNRILFMQQKHYFWWIAKFASLRNGHTLISVTWKLPWSPHFRIFLVFKWFRLF